ncbi:hypothetical protein G7007_08065 [Pseudomonas entomophila]|uniref:hypothetical protein n=1 Tax=Pseudomonas entomophila TaxID=312306 RepID=UPI0015E3E3C9|nr:hypothetical protein [Pseudomonas entomophila]MBA1192813.1 hypothetical protein [Pseudomonas entomophila]
MSRPLQTFQIDTPLQLLIKLIWNIKQLRIHLDNKDRAAAFFPSVYSAFDACITAWQLTDWVWKFYSPKVDLPRSENPKYQGCKPFTKFQGWVSEQSSALRICKHIANSNKHFGVDSHYDEDLKVFVDWKIETAFSAGMAAGRPLVDRPWQLMVIDSGEEHEILVVLRRAVEFWATEIREPSLIGMLDE